MKKWSIKVIVGSTTLGLVALGTGISLASTHTKAGLGPVTCIVTADAAAAVDANTALSDVFAVGTKLHFASAGRTVDVTVSAPLTKAAPATSATADPSAAPTSAAPTADPSAAPTSAAPTGAAPTSAAPTASAPGRKHHHHLTKRELEKLRQAAAAKKAAAEKASDAKTTKAAVESLPQVEVAGANDGVDPNTVCTQLSKNAFNTLGGVANGNNVGAFIAQMTPVADAQESAAAGQ
jgi:hypothetical protein